MIIKKNKTSFEKSIIDLIDSPFVQEMMHIPSHGGINCLDHSLLVSYLSYFICSRLELDYISAARGGLLHDIFLYNWRTENSHIGLHGLTHPIIALKKASALFPLSEMEKDIIIKHMWPITILMPKYKESFIVGCADKICAIIESFGMYHWAILHSELKHYGY